MDIFYELMQKYKNKNFKIVFENVENKKCGTEKFIFNLGKNRKENRIIHNIEDIYGENRRKKGIIGTTLVNILNSSSKIDKMIDVCKKSIEKSNLEDVESFYNEVFSIVYNSNIRKISNFGDYFEMIAEFSGRPQNVQLPYIEILKEIINSDELIESFLKSNSKINIDDLKEICNVCISSLELLKKSNLFILEGNFISNIMWFAENNFEKNSSEKISHSEIIAILKNHLDFLSNFIRDILGECHFIFTTFIDNFLYDFGITFSNPETFNTYTSFLSNMVHYTEPNNTYYKAMYLLLRKTDNYGSIDFLKDATLVFLIYLKSELLTIHLKLRNDSVSIISDSVDIPKSIINFSKQSNFLKPCKYTYAISSLSDFFNISLYHIYLDNRKVLKCHNCGRYFISDVRNNEVFCRRIDPKDPKKRPCAKIGVEKNRSTNSDNDVVNLHKKIYSRLHNNYGKRYKEDECDIFRNEYKKYKDEVLEKYPNTKYDKNYRNKYLLTWLEKYDKKLMKKYPSNRYGIKKKKKI